MSKYVRVFVVVLIAVFLTAGCDDALKGKSLDQKTMKPWDYCEKYPGECDTSAADD